MILRTAEEVVLRLSTQYPIVTVLGPRQSGKTTLCQTAFKGYNYVSLESLEDRNFAINDPKTFLRKFETPLIIDEIQRAPSILSEIQVQVDKSREKGQFILTGSQQLEIMEKLTQSLAGRTAILKLLPLTIDELYRYQKNYLTIEEYLYHGFYPRIHFEKLNPTEAYAFYVNTYLERDIRSLINLKDYILFDKFLKICAGRTGQLINLSSIGNECGLSHNTVSSWLGLLEASFIVFRLQPYFNNFSKRIVKSSKLYFYDVGLVSYLLGIESKKHLLSHPLKGQLFETMIVAEMIKERYNQVKQSNVYFFRDNAGHEVDALVHRGIWSDPVEIKLSETVQPDFFKGLEFFNQNQRQKKAQSFLVYGGNNTYKIQNAAVLSFRDIRTLMMAED